jgi:hypothetical protein
MSVRTGLIRAYKQEWYRKNKNSIQRKTNIVVAKNGSKVIIGVFDTLGQLNNWIEKNQNVDVLFNGRVGQGVREYDI